METKSIYNTLEKSTEDVYATLEQTRYKTKGHHTVPPTNKKKKTFLFWMLFTFLTAFIMAAVISAVLYFVIENKFKEYTDKLQHNLSSTTEELKQFKENFTVLDSHLSAVTMSLNKYCSVRNASVRGMKCVFCSEKWLPFNTKCYFFSTDAMNWNDSQDNCTSMGGHLVIIESKEEQNFLLNKTANKTDKSYWIGLTDQKTEGHFLWMNNKHLDENKMFWGRRDSDGGWEPNNWNKSGKYPEGQDCVRLNTSTKYEGWYDSWCGYNKQRICEATAALLHI